ncbi:helix-turn-helix transcriptional regulator [Streptomyces rubiginosohelvolus]|uniref:helix-turn-helix domain-containing protein n=1 Tax=Streptomyces rubiginosohelvolus TaxID=67362 RepID=UPI0033BD4BAA
MPKRKSESGPDTQAAVMLRKTFARLREEHGVTFQELDDRTTYTRAYLHKLETGARLGSPEVWQALDVAFGTRDQLYQLYVLAKDGLFGDRYAKFMKLEQEARVQYLYSASVIPGLLQTEEYAAALLGEARRDEMELREDVAARMSRQEILRGEDAPHFRALLDEAVFYRAAKDPEVWRGQLEALLEWLEQPNVEIQVVPFSAGLHDLMGGLLTVLWLPDGRSVAYSESATGGELIEESGRVEAMKLSYDLLRDRVLSVAETREFIRKLIKEIPPCATEPT